MDVEPTLSRSGRIKVLYCFPHFTLSYINRGFFPSAESPDPF